MWNNTIYNTYIERASKHTHYMYISHYYPFYASGNCTADTVRLNNLTESLGNQSNCISHAHLLALFLPLTSRMAAVCEAYQPNNQHSESNQT